MMNIVIDIPQGLKIDFENENWKKPICEEMRNALLNSVNMETIHEEIRKIDWYGDDAFWDGVNAVTAILNKYGV